MREADKSAEQMGWAADEYDWDCLLTCNGHLDKLDVCVHGALLHRGSASTRRTSCPLSGAEPTVCLPPPSQASLDTGKFKWSLQLANPPSKEA